MTKHCSIIGMILRSIVVSSGLNMF